MPRTTVVALLASMALAGYQDGYTENNQTAALVRCVR
jgi:hypothetical protein